MINTSNITNTYYLLVNSFSFKHQSG